MDPIPTDTKLIARCGLYCGSCGKFLRGRCPGCHGNEKASWCKIRNCCTEHSYASCADCTIFTDPVACAKLNNLLGRLFGLIFNSNRAACIAKIRELGPDGFAAFMATRRLQSLPRRGAQSQ